jgi:hypothetical protein
MFTSKIYQVRSYAGRAEPHDDWIFGGSDSPERFLPLTATLAKETTDRGLLELKKGRRYFMWRREREGKVARLRDFPAEYRSWHHV